MNNFWWSTLIGAAILLAAIPLVLRVRHTEQRPFAAYLIFVSLFAATAFVLFNLLTWLAATFEVQALLNQPLPALLFLALVFVPALALGLWQSRKPPRRQAPPP